MRRERPKKAHTTPHISQVQWQTPQSAISYDIVRRVPQAHKHNLGGKVPPKITEPNRAAQ